MAVPFVGTPKLSDTNFLLKKQRKKMENRKKNDEKMKEKRKKRDKESKTKLFIVKQWQ